MRIYEDFLSDKAQIGENDGFKPIWMPSGAFDFQQSVAEWNLWKGRSADFLDCGMGKSLISLIWGENVVRRTNAPVLILTPLAVAQQFVREGEKFGIEVTRTSGKVYGTGIHVTNYEKLHLFDPDDWSGVVCDESSCIKAFDGKRRAAVTEFLRTKRYRLMATATAAPNDYIELGTTSEALGILGQVDLLNTFFKNDQNTSDMKKRWRGYAAPRELTGPGWRFKGHAEIPFWRFVCSWSRSGRKPSDLGDFLDDRFILPPLTERVHIVDTRTLMEGSYADGTTGMMFALPATNMQEEREERRRTIPERCEMAAELVSATGRPYIIWCGLNDEGDLLDRLLPDAVQISGADSDEEKEEKYSAFLLQQSRGMISKQKIGGWGLNCQHCPHVVEFASHSFEQHYQGVRRCWRFGQTQEVTNDIIATEGQRSALESTRRKSAAADRMFTELVKHMNEGRFIDGGYRFGKKVEVPSWLTQ